MQKYKAPTEAKTELHPQQFEHRALAENIISENKILLIKISQSCQIPQAFVPEMLTEVIRFLNLIAYSNQILTPSKIIDDAWHEFILCTKSYWEFCEQTFGRMIHHHPGGSNEKNRDQYRQTLQLYREHFGEPDTRFWGREALKFNKADCGACEAVGNR